jgi:hypothetical protein
MDYTGWRRIGGVAQRLHARRERHRHPPLLKVKLGSSMLVRREGQANFYYHYGKLPLCCALETLSCVFFREHGKEELCRASFQQRTSKTTLGKKKACCVFCHWHTANIFPHRTLPSFTTVSLRVAFAVR